MSKIGTTLRLCPAVWSHPSQVSTHPLASLIVHDLRVLPQRHASLSSRCQSTSGPLLAQKPRSSLLKQDSFGWMGIALSTFGLPRQGSYGSILMLRRMRLSNSENFLLEVSQDGLSQVDVCVTRICRSVTCTLYMMLS